MATPLPSSSPDPVAESSGAALRAVERAAVALRLGGIALLTGPHGDGAKDGAKDGGNILVLAAEGASPAGLARLARLGDGETMLVLTARSASTPTNGSICRRRKCCASSATTRCG